MINSDQMRQSSSQRLTLSTMQNQRFYCNQKLKTPNKEFLKSNRSQLTLSDFQDSKSRANTLFEKIKAQNTNIHKSENNLFFKVEEAILELYNQYEQNYQGLGSLGRIKTVQENLSVEFKKQNNQLIKTFDGLKLSDLDQNGVNQIQIDRYQFYYFRLRILEKPTPIHIHLQLPESLSFLLFKLMISVKIEFPTKFNADQIVQSNYAKVYSSNPQAHYFKEEFLYLTFYSHVDFILKITVHFGQFNNEKTPSRGKESRSPKIMMVHSDEGRATKGFSHVKSHIYQSSIERETESSRVQTENSEKRKFIKIQPPVQSKLSTLLTKIGKEFQGLTKAERIKKIEELQIQKRKELVEDYQQKQKTFMYELEKRKVKIEQHSKIKKQKIELVQQNKKNNYSERQQSRRDRLFLQEQISQFREIERSLSIRKAYAYKVSLSWGRIIKYILFIDSLFNIIKDNKKKSKVQARGKLLVWTIKTKALISAKEYGYTTKERTITKSCIALKMIAINLKHKIKQQSQAILAKYFTQMRLAVTIVHQHDKTLKKSILDLISLIIQIQQNFRTLKQKKLTYRDKFLKLIKDNINQTIDELQRQYGKKTFYDNNDKPVQQMDTICANQLIDEYSKQKKQIWYEYINNKFFEKDFHKKMKDFAINLKEPQLYELPKRKELIQIIEKYGKIKKLL